MTDIIRDFNLRKAKWIYELNPNSIDPEKACVLLNCVPAQSLLYQKGKEDFCLSNEKIKRIERTLKDIEKKLGIGNYLSPKIACGIAIYINGIIEGPKISQKEIYSKLGINDAVFRKYYYRYLKLSIRNKPL